MHVPNSAWKDSAQDKRYPCTLAPIALATANLDGLSEQLAVDEVLVGGDVFRDFACNTAQSGAQGLVHGRNHEHERSAIQQQQQA